MKVLLVGATGTIGSAIHEELKSNDHEVFPASRRGEWKVDIEDSKSIQHLFSEIGPIDAVICAAGEVRFGNVMKLEDADWELSLRSKLLGQINLVRYGQGNTRKAFILTGGASAFSPWPETSVISTINAGIEGFVRGAARDLSKRVVVVHPPLLAESARHMGMDASKFPDAPTVARTYITALESEATGETFFVDGYFPRR